MTVLMDCMIVMTMLNATILMAHSIAPVTMGIPEMELHAQVHFCWHFKL